MKLLIFCLILMGCSGINTCRDFQVVISEKNKRVLSENLIFDIKACRKDMENL